MNLKQILSHLKNLVAFDTQNPPRNLSAEHKIFIYLQNCLQACGGFDISVKDHGDGHVTFYAVRGKPDLLFNVHLDTVPANKQWTYDPFQLVITEQKAYGLGACDIKGAVACLLTLAERTDKDLALLFTTDEEGANGCCIQYFIDAGLAQSYEQVVVAEPTQCQAISRHRGYLSVKGCFSGVAGHSSEPRALRENAIHKLVHWGEKALHLASGYSGSSCFNLGTVDGGIKSNVIADAASVHWSARLPPGSDNDQFLQQVFACGSESVEWDVGFKGPSLPCEPRGADMSEVFIANHELVHGQAVDFWTEASLFSAAGIPAIVLGPGDIAQAHGGDEWVSLLQLQQALDIYSQLAGNSHG